MQTTWVYCPVCENELTVDESPVREDKEGRVIYSCLQCGTESVWDFDAPVPLLLEQTPKENL